MLDVWIWLVLHHSFIQYPFAASVIQFMCRKSIITSFVKSNAENIISTVAPTVLQFWIGIFTSTNHIFFLKRKFDFSSCYWLSCRVLLFWMNCSAGGVVSCGITWCLFSLWMMVWCLSKAVDTQRPPECCSVYLLYLISSASRLSSCCSLWFLYFQRFSLISLFKFNLNECLYHDKQTQIIKWGGIYERGIMYL